jgi:hypothetical protein
MQDYTIHPAAEAFPLIDGDEFDKLVADIKANGLRLPITFNHDGSVLADGRNRKRACEIAGVEPVYEYLPESYSEQDIIDYIVSVNMRRREMTHGQKLATAAKLEPIYAAAARDRMLAGKKDPTADSPEGSRRENESREQAAKAADTSGRSLSDFKALRRDEPDLADAVEKGGMSLNAATTERKSRARKKAAAAESEAPQKDSPKPPTPRKRKPISAPAPNPRRPEMLAACADPANDHKSYEEIAEDLVIPWDTMRRELERDAIGRTAPLLDWSKIPGRSADKIRQDVEKRVTLFEQDFTARVKKDVNTLVGMQLKDIKSREIRADAIIKGHKGILTSEEYKAIWSCLHPDSRLSATDEKLSRAYQLFDTEQVKAMLIKDEDKSA